jgi:hypothetical protein
MSKLILFDFECENGHVFEELVQPDIHEHECPSCKATGIRQISTVRLNWREMGIDPDFPTCADKWAKMQEKKARVKEEGYNLTHY